MKTLDDERYVVIKADKFTIFEILRFFLYYYILHVHAIPTWTSSAPVECILWTILCGYM